jgi:hypothetical protein
VTTQVRVHEIEDALLAGRELHGVQMYTYPKLTD